jgi:hypothetical protein
MRVLGGNQWRGGFLDPHRGPGEYRVQVLAWKNLERLDGLYFVRPPSLRLLWNYSREIGPRELLRKVRSRGQERARNEKYCAIGVGRILEPAGDARFPQGQLVAFVAPCHPACVERLVLPAPLLIPIESGQRPLLAAGEILYDPIRGDGAGTDPWWTPLRGWSPLAGSPLSPEAIALALRRAVDLLQCTPWQRARRLRSDASDRVSERTVRRAGRSAARRQSAVLFGYGNYAKTVILPNVKPWLSVEAIHEIDPTQMPQRRGGRLCWDTSPGPREDEEYDVYLIAGFHHTHAPLAIHAMQRGACAVVEKPIVVDRAQLDDLLTVMREGSGGRLFCCFHKRYLPLNELALRDLALRPGDPVSYHCIIYEVPLPELHWYRWPHSRMDHFLYLNDFCDTRSIDLRVGLDGTLSCAVELENGAFFTMALTDQGSERIGLQEYIELRARGVTVRMINSSIYSAEGRDRILRRAKMGKYESYHTMYRQIGRRIREGAAGDSIHSVKASAELMLALEEKQRSKLDVMAGSSSHAQQLADTLASSREREQPCTR